MARALFCGAVTFIRPFCASASAASHPSSGPGTSARDFFGAAPLNYETLRRRVARLHAIARPPPAVLAQYIRANRRLQHTTKLHRHLGRHDLNPLGLPLHVSSTTLEHELWAELRRYWPICVASDHVVQTYVLTANTADIGPAFTLVTENYKTSGRTDLLPAVLALVALLLRRHDYPGCFKVLAVTVGAGEVARARRTQLVRAAAVVAAGAVISGAAGAALMPLCPVWGAVVGAGAVVASAAAVAGMFAPRRVGRVSWRPHTSALHRWLHRHEIHAVNKIVTYFEECHEVNSRNFHTSQVHGGDMAMFDRNDYEVQLPQQLEVVGAGAGAGDERVQALARYVRGEIHRQRMVWNALDEERMFLDFWVSHGENFEWVEPDQDPAEIVRFRR